MTSIARFCKKEGILPVRTKLDHTVGFHGRFGATFFVTICCKERGTNQLCHGGVAQVIFETARRYHASERWYLELLVLMPDHVHMLIAIDSDAALSNLIRDFKRIIAREANIRWQRNFFDHRLRHDESEDEKAEYIRQNPIRAALIAQDARWRYMIDANDLEQ